MNRTDKKLLTMGSVIKSFRPNDLIKSIEKISSLVDSLDENVALKASVVIIEQCNGKAGQKVEHSGKIEVDTPSYDLSNMTTEEKRKLRDKIASIRQ